MSSSASTISESDSTQDGLRAAHSAARTPGIVKSGSHGQLKRLSVFYRSELETRTRIVTTTSDHEQLELRGIWFDPVVPW